MAEKKENAPVKDQPAKKRTILTPAERLKKAEAELAELRAKAEADAKKKVTVLIERRNKLIDRATDIEAKVKAVDAELRAHGHEFSNELVVFVAADKPTEG